MSWLSMKVRSDSGVWRYVKLSVIVGALWVVSNTSMELAAAPMAECQQNCVNEATACAATCNADTEDNSYAETVCLHDCTQKWEACSMGAYYCEDPEETFCYTCFIYQTPSCVSQTNCNSSTIYYGTPSMGCWQTTNAC